MSATRTVTFRGLDFRIQEGAVHKAYSLNCFTEDEADFREKYWKPEAGQYVADVGASYGAYSLTAAAMGACVFAWEPEPTVAVDLEANVALNPWLEVHVSRMGLWDKEEKVPMATYAPHWPKGTVSVDFPMTTLDSYKLPRLDWLKIDVEGCEARVLKGALETLRRCQPTVIVEVHKFLDATLLGECKAILADAMYSKFEEAPRDPCVMLIARPS